jgi:hypothetical protein
VSVPAQYYVVLVQHQWSVVLVVVAVVVAVVAVEVVVVVVAVVVAVVAVEVVVVVVLVELGCLRLMSSDSAEQSKKRLKSEKNLKN